MLYQGSSSQISAQSRNNSPHERLFTGICLWGGSEWFVNPLFASKEQPSRLMLIRDLLIGGVVRSSQIPKLCKNPAHSTITALTSAVRWAFTTLLKFPRVDAHKGFTLNI